MNKRIALAFAAAFFWGWVPAWAEGPAVSNLTFTQGPDGGRVSVADGGGMGTGGGLGRHHEALPDGVPGHVSA